MKGTVLATALAAYASAQTAYTTLVFDPDAVHNETNGQMVRVSSQANEAVEVFDANSPVGWSI